MNFVWVRTMWHCPKCGYYMAEEVGYPIDDMRNIVDRAARVDRYCEQCTAVLVKGTFETMDMPYIRFTKLLPDELRFLIGVT